MPTITPFLWFETQAEDAMNFYLSVFPRSKVLAVHRANGQGQYVEFEIEGQKLMALNGGPHYKLTDAFSLFVNCETQAEIDALWDKLTADGGAPNRCGWLKDRYGLSWQIIPSALGRLMGGGTPEQSNRVMEALFQMEKIDLKRLQTAYDG